jgi:ATP-binding cassette subfamily B protein
MLGITVIALAAAYITEAVVALLQGWLMAGVSQRIIQNLRKTLFLKLQKLPIPFFDIHTHGDLMSRFANDMENISGTISQATTQLLSSIITVTGALVMMLVLSPY